MNTQILTEALRALDTGAFAWKYGLYSTHKGRDGVELEWHLCNMQGIGTQVDSIREFLLKKPVADKPVAEYSPFLSDKESIGALEYTDELIRDQVQDIILNIKNGQAYAPEDYSSGVLPKTVGYSFYGELINEDGSVQDQVILMRRSNPFLSGQAAQLLIGEGDSIVSCSRPLIKMTAAVDFLLIGGVCYILSSGITKDLSLEDRHFAIAQKRMELITESEMVSDYYRFEACVMKAKNARKFLSFDKSVLEHITRLPVMDREEYLSTYGVTIDKGGRMDTSDPEQCELIIDLLCGRSCLDPLGRLSVVSNIAPRE